MFCPLASLPVVVIVRVFPSAESTRVNGGHDLSILLIDQLRRRGIHPRASGRIAVRAADDSNIRPVIVRRVGVVNRGAVSRHLVHRDLDACTRRLIDEGGALGRLTLAVLRFLEVEFPGANRLSERRASAGNNAQCDRDRREETLPPSCLPALFPDLSLCRRVTRGMPKRTGVNLHVEGGFPLWNPRVGRTGWPSPETLAHPTARAQFNTAQRSAHRFTVVAARSCARSVEHLAPRSWRPPGA